MLAGEIFGGDVALQVVPPEGAEDVAPAAVGQRRVAGRGRDHDHPRRLVDRGGGDRGLGAGVADDGDHPFRDEAPRERDRLRGIAVVVAEGQLHPLPEQAARGVDVVDRELRAVLPLLAVPGETPGHGRGRGDQDVGPGRRRGEERHRGEEDGSRPSHHGRLPCVFCSGSMRLLAGAATSMRALCPP